MMFQTSSFKNVNLILKFTRK